MTYQELLQKPEIAELIKFTAPKVSKEKLQLPSADFVNRIFGESKERSANVVANINRLFNSGTLAGTGYLTILAVDQGVEHSAGFSFAKHVDYFDPVKLADLAIASGCSAYVGTLGSLSILPKNYSKDLALILKLNHNELLTFPNKFDQNVFASIDQAVAVGATAVGATIYFGSADSARQIREVTKLFEEAHKAGLATILWCYLRNDAFKINGVDYHTAADLSGQANHLGVTVGADIIKQKMSFNNGGYKALGGINSGYGKFDEAIYTDLCSDNPIDLNRYQVLNCYAGRIPLINSGGESGSNDLEELVKQAIINKRAGGSGAILGRKIFKRAFDEGVSYIKLVQEVYKDPAITIA